MIYTVTLNPAVDYVIQVPAFQEGQLNVTQRESKFPGGKGINVSRVLKRLGVVSTNLGFIGGFTGQFIEDKLKEEALQTDFVTVAGDTRINIKLKSTEETEINGQGPVITEIALQELKTQLNQLTSEDLVVFSGSVPKGVAPTIYVEFVELLSKKGIPFVVDISSKQLLDILPFKPVLIKPNHHELSAIFETEFASVTEMLPYGEKLRSLGAQNVLISMGKDGALLFSDKGIYQVEGLSGVLKNSVGAGDSMVAGFISQWVASKETSACLTYGVAAGSATAFSDDLATGEAILALVEKVSITTIKEY
ncbi:MAG: 1-phosphofructokinase [Vagococcus sp.]